MINLKFFLVSYNRCDQRIISELSDDEKKTINCYSVQSNIPKFITAKVPIINEWELNWHNNRYQTLQYYEYGTIIHCIKNDELIKDITHVGLLHYDVYFPKNSINEIIEILDKNPNTIFYNTLRTNNQLYFTKEQLKHICAFMSNKLDIDINYEYIWNNYWISEALSITPINVYKNFGEFLYKYQYEIENILNSNLWGIMNNVKHRLCGFIERLWGIYLVSLRLPLEQMKIIHEWSLYEHKHLIDKNNFLNRF